MIALGLRGDYGLWLLAMSSVLVPIIHPPILLIFRVVHGLQNWWMLIVGLHQILPTALLVILMGFCKATQCIVIFILPPIVLPGFVWLCMDCRIDIGLPIYCNAVLVPIILQPFVLIGSLGLCKDWWVEVGFCHSWLGFMFSSSIIPGCMNWSYSVMIVRNCAITF